MGPDAAARSPQTVPFEELWINFVERAARALEPRLDTSLRDAVLNDPAGPLHTLLADLAEAGAPAAFELFAHRRSREITALQVFGGQAGRRIYDAFVRDLRATSCSPLWQAFPALGPILARRVEDFVATTIELNDRFVADRARLGAAIPALSGWAGRITIRSGLSDAHRGGRRVSRLSFENGQAVYYKPRPVDMEEGFAGFVAWFNGRRGRWPRWPTLRALATIGGQDYGWMEAACSRPCEDAAAMRRYYRRAGMVLALADLFCGVDFHHENVIADGEFPMLVDMETLFHPRGPYEHDVDELNRTELLPRPLRHRAGEPFVPCGLGLLPAGPEFQVLQHGWRDVNQDSMNPCEHLMQWTGSDGIPHFVDGSVPAISEWANEVAAGFTGMHRFFLAHRTDLWAPGGPVERAFGGRRTRFVARATRVYAKLIRRATHPRVLEDPKRMDPAAELLRHGGRGLSDLYRAESAAIARLEVPYLTVETHSRLIQGEGHTLGGIVTLSGMELARQRAARMDERAIANRASFVASELASARYPGSAPFPPDVPVTSSAHGVASHGSTPHQSS